MNDLINRQAAIDAVNSWRGRFSEEYNEAIDDCENSIIKLPSIQPELSIPLSWIERYIEWLKSLDNEFVNLAAAHISVMVKKWRREQNETDCLRG